MQELVQEEGGGVKFSFLSLGGGGGSAQSPKTPPGNDKFH